jgi:putative aldouronate transport system permease protein
MNHPNGWYKGYIKESYLSKIFDVLNTLLMLGVICIVLYPFINLLAISLNEGTDATTGGIYLFPRRFSLDSYVLLVNNPNLLKGLLISVLRVVVGTVTCVFVTGLLAYIVCISNFSGRKFMRMIFIFTMFFNGGLIPTYLLIVRLGLIDTFTVYWLPNLIDAFYMLIMASFIQNLSESLMESARIDGYSELRIYFQIVVPISVPVFAAIAIFTSVFQWNSWFDTLIYNSSGTWDTLQSYLMNILLKVAAIQQVRDQEEVFKGLKNISTVTVRAATTIIVTLPIVFVYPFFQKYLIGGITLGSVKG